MIWPLPSNNNNNDDSTCDNHHGSNNESISNSCCHSNNNNNNKSSSDDASMIKINDRKGKDKHQNQSTKKSKKSNGYNIDLNQHGLKVYVHIDYNHDTQWQIPNSNARLKQSGRGVNGQFSNQTNQQHQFSIGLSASATPLRKNYMRQPTYYYQQQSQNQYKFGLSASATPLRNNYSSQQHQQYKHQHQYSYGLSSIVTPLRNNYSSKYSQINRHNHDDDHDDGTTIDSLSIPTLQRVHIPSQQPQQQQQRFSTPPRSTTSSQYNNNINDVILKDVYSENISMDESFIHSLSSSTSSFSSLSYKEDDVTFNHSLIFIDNDDNGVVTFEYRTTTSRASDYIITNNSTHDENEIIDDQIFNHNEWNFKTPIKSNSRKSSLINDVTTPSATKQSSTSPTSSSAMASPSSTSNPSSPIIEYSSTNIQMDRENKMKQYLSVRLACLEVAAEQYKKMDIEVPDIIVAQVNDHRHQLLDHDRKRNNTMLKTTPASAVSKIESSNTNENYDTIDNTNDNNNMDKNSQQQFIPTTSTTLMSLTKRERIRLRQTDEIHVSPCQCALRLMGMRGKGVGVEGEPSLFNFLMGMDNREKSTLSLDSLNNNNSKGGESERNIIDKKKVEPPSMVRTQSTYVNSHEYIPKNNETHGKNMNQVETLPKPQPFSTHHRSDSATFDNLGYHEITLIRNRNSSQNLVSNDFIDWDAITIRCSNHDELDLLVEALKGTSKAKVVPFSSNPKEKLKIRKEETKSEISQNRRRLYSDPSDTAFMKNKQESIKNTRRDNYFKSRHESLLNEKRRNVEAISEDEPLFMEEKYNETSKKKKENIVKNTKDNAASPKNPNNNFFNKKEYCEVCDLVFTLFTRRHHCRQCQRSICGNCSSLLLVKGGDEKRFCIRCSTEILRKQTEALRGRLTKKHLQSDKLPGKVHNACYRLGVGVMGKLPHWKMFLTRNVDDRPAVGRITIEVLEAIALPSANKLNDKVDSYVRATITGYDRDMTWTLREWLESKQYSLCSGYVTSTLSPQWRGTGRKGGELLTLPIISTAGAVLRLEVLDRGMKKEDLVLGIVEIPLSDLPNANLRQPGGININSNGKRKNLMYDGYCDRWYRLLSSDQVSGNSVVLSKPMPCPLSKESTGSKEKPQVVKKSLQEIGRKVQGLWIQPIEWVASAIKLDLPIRRPEAICEEHKSRSMIHVRIKLNASVGGDILSHAWFPPVKPYASVPPFDPQVLFGRLMLIGKQLKPYKRIQEYIEKCIKWKHEPKVCIRAYVIFAFHLALLPYLVKIFHVYLFIFLGIRLKEIEKQSDDENNTKSHIPHVDSMSSEDMTVAASTKEDEQIFQNSPSLAELNESMGAFETKTLGTRSNSASKDETNDEESARLNIAVHWIAKKWLDNKGLEIFQHKMGCLGRDLKNLNSVWNGTNPLLTRAAMVYLVISFILHFVVKARLLWFIGTFTWYFGQSPFCILCIRMFFGFWRGIAKGLRRQHLLDAEILDAL